MQNTRAKPKEECYVLCNETFEIIQQDGSVLKYQKGTVYEVATVYESAHSSLCSVVKHPAAKPPGDTPGHRLALLRNCRGLFTAWIPPKGYVFVDNVFKQVSEAHEEEVEANPYEGLTLAAALLKHNDFTREREELRRQERADAIAAVARQEREDEAQQLEESRFRDPES